MRKLWIARINAASRSQGMPYNQFMHGLKVAGVNINRKMLADLAVRDSQSFNELIAVAKGGPKACTSAHAVERPERSIELTQGVSGQNEPPTANLREVHESANA